MKSKGLTVKFALLITLAGLILALGGCNEIDIPILVDTEELSRYINESSDAQALFRTDGLITDNPYTAALDPGAVYTDQVDSVLRSISAVITVDELQAGFINAWKLQGVDTFANFIQDFGSPYGQTKDAEAVVEDLFFVQTRRVIDNDTTTLHSIRKLIRYAYFLKVGDDSQSYAGWLLYGYSGGGPTAGTRMEVVRENATTFPGDSTLYRRFSSILIDTYASQGTVVDTILTDEPYIRLSLPDGITRTGDGETLTFRTTQSHNLSHLMTIGAKTDGGYVQQSMSPDGDIAYKATIKTPDNNKPSWNVVYLQEFRRLPGDPLGYVPINILDYKGWCVPYRVE